MTACLENAARRAQLLAWAGRSDALIFEDDYDSEFRFDAKPVPTLYAMDDGACTIYAGTFSKVLSPGLRLGYLVLPEDLVDVYVRMKTLATGGCARTLQQILAEFIAKEQANEAQLKQALQPLIEK